MTLGPLLVAKYADYAPYFPEQKRTAAQLSGLRYEAKVLKQLATLYPKMEASPWLYYKTAKTSGVCQPDALLWLTPKLLCLVEIKLSRQAPVRSKLLDFYGPIVQAIHPSASVCYLQIYKYSKKAAHKRKLSFYKLDEIKQGTYRECQHLL